MCRRDEAIRDARERDIEMLGAPILFPRMTDVGAESFGRMVEAVRASEGIAARLEVCNRFLPAEELERIRNRVELGAEIPEDCGRLLEHIVALEAELAELRRVKA